MLTNDPLTARANASAVCYQHSSVMVGCNYTPIRGCRYVDTPAGLLHARCFAVGLAILKAGKRKTAAANCIFMSSQQAEHYSSL